MIALSLLLAFAAPTNEGAKRAIMLDITTGPQLAPAQRHDRHVTAHEGPVGGDLHPYRAVPAYPHRGRDHGTMRVRAW